MKTLHSKSPRRNVRKALVLLMVPVLLGATTPPAVAEADQAHLTELHGNVFKRLFEAISDALRGIPIRASLNDKLPEGSELGTGNSSWSQISWTEVVTRQWANTVVKIAPGQRTVFLSNGDMLFRLKKEGPSQEYRVKAKVLQARIRGTTVLFQRTSEVTRVSVIEGTIDVHNNIDGSDVTLGPGAVYEVLTPPGKEQEEEKDPTKKPEDSEVPPLPWIGPEDRDIRTPVTTDPSPQWKPDREKAKLPEYEICKTDIPPVETFRTPESQTSIWVEDRDAVLNHPLIRSFDQPLDSMPLINISTNKLPDICFKDRKNNSTNPLADRNKLLGSIVEVINGPSSSKKVEVGKELGYRFSMPTPVAAGAKPEKIKVPAVVHTSYTQPRAVRGNRDQQLTDLKRQFEDAWRKCEDFKIATLREKQDKMSRLKDCYGLSPDECQSRKQQLERWEREQKQKCDSLHKAANDIKAQMEQLRNKPYR